MKKKTIALLILSTVVLSGCGVSKWPDEEDVVQVEEGLNKSLTDINAECEDVYFLKPEDDKEKPMFSITLKFDNGLNFGKKCKIVSTFIKNYSDGKYKDYVFDVREINASAERLISWDSETELYMNTLNGKESMYTLDDIGLEELIAMDNEQSGNESSVTETTEESDEEYISLLKKYSEIFSEELKVFDTSEQLIQAISGNKNTSEVIGILESAVASTEKSEETLNNYFAEFDSNRQQMPYGTRIMTLLAHAQSAVTQYNIALSHLNDFLLSSDQDDIAHFQKYMEKAEQSLNDYNSILNEELAKIN